ncbi:hypothetical protein PUF88_04925 [Lactobacillaceae bacterium L1_55_11]|nr:hypothetical protein [Lactobacillaceae bacterium L1_55_11]
MTDKKQDQNEQEASTNNSVDEAKKELKESGEKTKRAAEKASEETKEAAHQASHDTKEAGRKAKEQFDQAAATSKEQATKVANAAKEQGQKVYQASRDNINLANPWVVLGLIIVILLAIKLFFGSAVSSLLTFIGELLLTIVHFAAWPIVVVGIVYYYRHEIRDLLNRFGK